MAKFTGESWTVEDIAEFWNEIDRIGKNFNLSYPETQIEIISYDQMIDTITTIGAPCSHDHWSLGKDSIALKKQYNSGHGGLALELIINSDPTIMYVAENNTLIQQGLVLAHAGLGHGSVFKNNYLFQQWTDPQSILDFFKFGKDFIAKCEIEHGSQAVELLIDICKALEFYAVSHHKRKRLKHFKQRVDVLAEELLNADSEVINKKYKNKIARNLSAIEKSLERNKVIELPEENILYFIEKHSSVLTNWQREILRISRKTAEYFYPQRLTKILHEGWASFVQMRVFEQLYKEDIIDEGGFLEFLRNHVNVIYQPDHDSPHYSGNLNPYAIGYAIFEDLYRMTTDPNEEDLINYPEICNTDWTISLMNIVKNYSDSDLISRYLTPNVIRRFRLFAVEMDGTNSEIRINGTAFDFDTIREYFSNQLNLFAHMPRIEVTGLLSEGSLQLTAYPMEGCAVDTDSLSELVEYLEVLWGEDVYIRVPNN